MGDYSTPENCYSQTDIRNINRYFLEEYVKKACYWRAKI